MVSEIALPLFWLPEGQFPVREDHFQWFDTLEQAAEYLEWHNHPSPGATVYLPQDPSWILLDALGRRIRLVAANMEVISAELETSVASEADLVAVKSAKRLRAAHESEGR